MNNEEVLKDTQVRMGKAVEALKKELLTIRTGRAHPGLVEHIKVDYHGVLTPLNQLASVFAPEARLLLIQPWEKAVLQNIEKAILKSELSLNPTNDGNVIRISIPQLTEERRGQLVKMVHKIVEEERVAVRNVRRDALEKLRKLKDSKELSEDEQKRDLVRLQTLTDKFIEEINAVSSAKEAELLEI